MSEKTRCRTCDLYEDGEQVPCHRCGHMPERAVLPGCYATAVSATSTTDLSRCTCERLSRKDALVARMERAEARIAALEDLLPGKDNMVDLRAALASTREGE